MPTHCRCLGFCFTSKGTIARLKRAAEFDPADPSIAEFLGDLFVECEQFTDAVPHDERAIALAPEERSTLHLSLGSALQEDGRLDEAGEQYQIAHRLAPNTAMVFSYLGGFHEEKGDLVLPPSTSSSSTM
jgi:Flp pilus assembly protein TadD